MPLDRRDAALEFAALAAEEDRRAREALRVYRPAPMQMPFHQSTARELILRGGKRSGKSVAVAIEFASRVLGEPIYGPANRDLPLKYPVSTPKDPMLYWVIGWDVDHIGQTIYRLLFQPGLFRVIQDRATGLWRVFNPADEFDLDRYAESRPAEPVIPERFIDPMRGVNGWVWENAGARNFSTVYLKNGAVICAYPSSSKHAKQGDAVSGIWIDEDIQIPDHLKEWQDRLTDKDGWLLWSVWPHSKNYALCNMLDRAEEQAGEEAPNIASFQLIMSQNPFLKKDAKERALERMGSDEEIARRDRGELMLDALSMYDFIYGLHTVQPYSAEEIPAKVQYARELLQMLYTQQGAFPRTWTRYLAIDPSHTRTACLSSVVPPPEIDNLLLGNVAIVEWELVLRKHSAEGLAAALRPKLEGYNYEAFIMDQQIGRQTRVGEDQTIFQTYADAFARHGLRCRLCPTGFIPGCNIPPTRYRAVRHMMDIQKTGIPQLLLVAYRTPETQLEFKTYRKKQLFVSGEDTIMDEPANPRKHDCMAALEYLCAFLETQFAMGVAYMPPETYASRGSPAYRRAMKLLKKREASEHGVIHFGPGAAA